VEKGKFAAFLLIGCSVVLAVLVAVGGWYFYKTYGHDVEMALTINKNNKSNQSFENGMFTSYMANVQNKIRSNWNPPNGDESRKVVLVFKVGRDGNILSHSVNESSGDKVMDDAAVEALMKSQPFEPLPKDFSGNSVDIQFSFDYNVHKKN
jgi:TonB family protein